MTTAAALTYLRHTILRALPEAETAAFVWNIESRTFEPATVSDARGAVLWERPVSKLREAPATTAIDVAFDAAAALTRSLDDAQANPLLTEGAHGYFSFPLTSASSRASDAELTYEEDRRSGRELRELRWEMRESRAERRDRRG